MLRLLLPILFCVTTTLFAQPAPIEGPGVPMGPFQLPSRGDFAGDWLRYDGVYTLTVHVDEDEVTVDYFNPQPIQVESARMASVDGDTAMTVVLRDAGYPGSTYQLYYLPQSDVLIGTYTIPGQAPTEVYFKRK